MIVNAVLVLGTVTAAAVSLEPHFSSAYQLHFGLLAANLLPYLLYAAITACRRGTPIDVLGLVLVITHVGLLAWPGLGSTHRCFRCTLATVGDNSANRDLRSQASFIA